MWLSYIKTYNTMQLEYSQSKDKTMYAQIFDFEIMRFKVSIGFRKSKKLHLIYFIS